MPEQNDFAISGSSPELSQGTPQFSTAEYGHIPGTERCQICNNLLAGDYYRVNGLMACAQCATDAKNGQPRDSHAAFTRGLLLGIGAAVVGLIAYATFTIITGWYIGFIALGVGWFVAKAIKKGSSGLGGRRYQIAAVLLTYAAISMAAVPIGIAYMIKESKIHKQAQTQQQTDAAGSADSQQAQTADQAAQPDQPAESKKQGSYGAAVMQLLFLGLASPFLELQDPGHGFIGLIILFVGLRIAWQLTASAPLEVDGPYSQSARV